MGNGPPIKVADLNTAIPNGTGNFTAFFGKGPPIIPSVRRQQRRVLRRGQRRPAGRLCHGKRPADSDRRHGHGHPRRHGQFHGVHAGGRRAQPGHQRQQRRLLRRRLGRPAGHLCLDYVAQHGPPIKIADTATLIPGGTGTFTAFPQHPSLSGDNVAFLGNGSGGQQGLYRAALNGPPIRIADTATPIPGGTGNFTSFLRRGPPIAPAIDGTSVAFFGAGSGGQQGIYVSVSARRSGSPTPRRPSPAARAISRASAT